MATMEQLKELFAATTSVDNKIRQQAEDTLIEAAKQPSYVQIVLQLIATPSGQPQEMVIQQAAAVHFRNVIKKAWVPPEKLDEDQADLSNGIRLDENVRAMIKEHLVQLMVKTPPSIQAQLSSAISIIAETDYHQNWQSLLPSLVAQLESPDLHTIMGVLKTANAIFKMFRNVPKSDPLFRVIVYTLEGIAQPLTKLMQQLGAHVATPQVMQNEKALEEHLEAIRLICRIFYSLNWQDLPEYFENHMGVWMTEFNKYMQVGIFSILDNEDEPSVLDKLQVAIIEIWGLWADKDEEEFVDKYLTGCTKLVWDRLVSLTLSSKDDVLATKSMKFLANLVLKPMYGHIFKPGLENMVEKVVIPNLTFREDIDEERFEDNPHDYILTEIEGSDMESRRRCAQDLLSCMNRNMEQETSEICLKWVHNLLQRAADPAQWAAKDAAIHLFINIAIRRENMSGVAEINSHANVYDFFTKQILPELRDGNYNERPVVKVAAIKFMATFRKQFSREHYIELLPNLISHLSSSSIVVHSFAAYTIERMLVTRDEKNTPKIEGPQLQPFLQPLFNNLFAIVDNTQLEENTYVMKCIMRSLWTGRNDVAAVAEHVTSRLTASMQRVSKDVRKPDYNHYLFESLAVLVKAVCMASPQNAVAFEEVLKEPFTYILSQEIVEFTPYVFQILAQLLEYRPREAGLSDFCASLFNMIKNPVNWAKRGDIPALSRLVKAYIEQAPEQLEPSLTAVLGIFQKLMTIRATEKQGMTILNAIIANYDLKTIQPYLKDIFSILLTRLTKVQHEKFKSLVASFIGLVVAKYGGETLCNVLNSLGGNGLVEQVVDKFWAGPLYDNPPVQATEAKHQVIGVALFLFEPISVSILDTNQTAWMKLVMAVVKILSSSTFANSARVTGLDNEDVVEVQYDSQFAELVFSRARSVDPFPENTNFKRDFVGGLARLSQSRPGQIGPLLQQADEKTKAQLGTLLHEHGVQL